MATIWRFLKVFTLGTWLGGMLFFGFIVAPILFSTLTNMDTAGAIVGLTLARLHLYGVIAAIVYLVTVVLEARSAKGLAHPAAILVSVMLLLTLTAQFWITPQMEALRAQMGSYMNTAANSPLRLQFNRLHEISVRIEGAVLLLGVIALILTVWQKTSRQFPGERPAPNPSF